MDFKFGQSSITKPAKKAGFSPARRDDPLAGVEYTGNIEADSAAELDALAQGFRQRRDAEEKRFKAATDSEYWFAVCFKDRASKDEFLKTIKAVRLGDKYVDGHALARLLGVDLEGS